MKSRIVAAAAAWLALSAPALAQAPPTPLACGGVTTVATGGTPVVPLANVPVTTNVITNGGYITNPPTATDQGIATAEELYLDPTSITAGSVGNGTTVALPAGASWYFPPGVNLAKLSVNAVTNGHKITCARW